MILYLLSKNNIPSLQSSHCPWNLYEAATHNISKLSSPKILRSATFLTRTILTWIWLNSFFYLSLNRTFRNNWYISIMTVKMYIQEHHGRIKLRCSITWNEHRMNLSMNKRLECCVKRVFFFQLGLNNTSFRLLML